MLFKKNPKEERRKYRRLDTILPVEFQILDKGFNPISGWHQGFSQDVSKSGLCLTINDLSKEESLNLEPQSSNLLLQIHSPVSDRCFLAFANVIWIKKIKELPFVQLAVGVNFTKIDSKEISKFINYVRFKKILWHTLQFLVIGILLSLVLLVSKNLKLNAYNASLLEKYSFLLHKDFQLREDYKVLLETKEEIDKVLNDNKIEMEILKASMSKIEDAKNKEITELEKKLEDAKKTIVESEKDAIRIKDLKKQLEDLKNIKDKDIDYFQKEILALREKEKMLTDKLRETIAKESEIKAGASMIKEEEIVLGQKLKEQLYNWLRNHQVQKTGLVVSFEGDHNLRDASFVYDQALSIITFTLFGDNNKAKKCLDFFLRRARRLDNDGFYNAYYSNNGDVAEYIAHAGPNLWLGIAILQYTNKTKDYTYIPLARGISGWIKSLQDKEGGIIGGKDISWYSTEHNLDGFAFFNMFYELTKEKEYADTANLILDWLNKYAYGNEPPLVNRGKGDSTIATDTYAWSIAALGPKLLKELNMDPDEILEFAIENCLVTTDFIDRFGKVISVDGFDFAKQQHVARGGIVSCEWTAQMVLSFEIMSDYYSDKGDLKKATHYRNLALKYLNELNKMVISSLSSFGQGNWCLPYASQENVDTGHGWRTPKGNRTGSVAATAYTIFAISEFNPLRLQN